MNAEKALRSVRDALVAMIDQSNTSMVAGMRRAGYREEAILIAIAEYWATDGLCGFQASIKEMAQAIETFASEHKPT